jgi:hypothetical protein
VNRKMKVDEVVKDENGEILNEDKQIVERWSK